MRLKVGTIIPQARRETSFYRVTAATGETGIQTSSADVESQARERDSTHDQEQA